MSDRKVEFLIFDVESVADGNLISNVKYPSEGLSPEAAVRRFRDELMAEKNSDFIPYTFQFPISVVVAKVDKRCQLIDLAVLDDPAFQPHVITDLFWRGWAHYQHPTLVSFNGRSFDVPLLELAAFRFGITVKDWFSDAGRSFELPRNRYNTKSHVDLQDALTNFGATRFHGGLNLASKLLGKPGKMDTQGFMVQDMYDQGRLAEINSYCRCDVLDTYFLFLRWQVMAGNLTLSQEHERVESTRGWLESQAPQVPAFRDYLSNWGEWKNPWSASK
ncbi:MAG: 3'-5' exonuclease [Planctomycetota bacterium]|nr:3'-5' exonuclease [Planctomycetota bacterium]MDA1179149.1 3'-5' exonuclease [Planctomycetota bacterium]